MMKWHPELSIWFIREAHEDDQVVWGHAPNNVYTMQSGYSWLLLQTLGMEPHTIFWKELWKVKTLPKIQLFGWRLGHDILLTTDRYALFSQGAGFSDPKYGALKEDVMHSLRDYPISTEALVLCNIHNDFLCMTYYNAIDWLKWLWGIWTNELSLVFLCSFRKYGK